MKLKLTFWIVLLVIAVCAFGSRRRGLPLYTGQRNPEDRMQERLDRLQEDRKARAQTRLERSREKSQETLSLRKIVELERRVQDLEYIVMPCPVLPPEITNDEDAKLYELTYRKLQRDAAARMTTKIIKRACAAAGMASVPKKLKTSLEQATYDILLETFLQEKHRRRHLQ